MAYEMFVFVVLRWLSRTDLIRLLDKHDLPLISTLRYGKLVSKYKDDGGTNICQRRSFPVSLCGVVTLNKHTLVCDIYHRSRYLHLRCCVEAACVNQHSSVLLRA